VLDVHISYYFLLYLNILVLDVYISRQFSAISRSRNRNNQGVYQGVYQGRLLKNDKIFTQNVAYKEIFNI